MLSKNKIKYIGRLASKKFRTENSLFMAEGRKTVNELLQSHECELLLHTYDYEIPSHAMQIKEVLEVDYSELREVSMLETPQNVLAIFKIKRPDLQSVNPQKELVIAIDGVQDAGNLGTIIRVADWFGIEDIVCSVGTVDIYNPKCIQATMGALARVRVHYTDLYQYLRRLERGVEIYATALDGANIYTSDLRNSGIVVFGNEGNGVSPDVISLSTKRLLIPSYPAGRPTSESLNVGVAAAIVCAEFRRCAIR